MWARLGLYVAALGAVFFIGWFARGERVEAIRARQAIDALSSAQAHINQYASDVHDMLDDAAAKARASRDTERRIRHATIVAIKRAPADGCAPDEPARLRFNAALKTVSGSGDIAGETIAIPVPKGDGAVSDAARD